MFKKLKVQTKKLRTSRNIIFLVDSVKQIVKAKFNVEFVDDNDDDFYDDNDDNNKKRSPIDNIF